MIANGGVNRRRDNKGKGVFGSPRIRNRCIDKFQIPWLPWYLQKRFRVFIFYERYPHRVYISLFAPSLLSTFPGRA